MRTAFGLQEPLSSHLHPPQIQKALEYILGNSSTFQKFLELTQGDSGAMLESHTPAGWNNGHPELPVGSGIRLKPHSAGLS